jgi:hypothetical protein
MQEHNAPVSLSTIAAITAALAVMLERSPDTFIVKSIEPVALYPRTGAALTPAPSLWPKAGLLAAQMSRASFGQRTKV